ncbi:hypothetical protein NI17_019235 [Thermobifida halotolerans]|uniref:Uncharacterized protein n=1 Tax=Thermobifida halotolerans TaxID=483545 RepID=A0AA97M3E2_9ACTN|nr:hypothetical protein [Thermobifida halotolerans]UOE18881.1 hypothetical protein NI17_019235 [Thermobifida halotolerans]
MEFADPVTRRLVEHTGSTTEFLEQRTGHPLAVRVLRQDRCPAPSVCRSVADILRLDRDAQVVVRHSELAAPDGAPVSRNIVVAGAAADPRLAAALADLSRPLGRTLAPYAADYERELVASGRSPWHRGTEAQRAGTGRAVWRGYVIRSGGAPVLYVEERFDPRLVDAS